ncbi:hypothetical protein [Flammeovirga pacifica]|uniref:Uncharacterized protein n=1 Tax=Flammeovirga pacifica TaxID=915059 RepID=A0A1S1Z0V7_FLAPC|nr:hypothetical protein [Flammeovirga pacifica]OHX66735.1 hypothetical protein NH26_10380 [Flammeovirga pacifica]
MEKFNQELQQFYTILKKFELEKEKELKEIQIHFLSNIDSIDLGDQLEAEKPIKDILWHLREVSYKIQSLHKYLPSDEN